MLLQAKFEEERNVRKVLLKVSELESPLPGTNPPGKRRKIDNSERVDLQPRALTFASNTKSMGPIDTAEDSCEGSGSLVENDSTRISKNSKPTVDESPKPAMEKYVEIALVNVNKQKAKLEQLRQQREEIAQKLEAASLAAGDTKTILILIY